jgi:hypothetical protein
MPVRLMVTHLSAQQQWISQSFFDATMTNLPALPPVAPVFDGRDNEELKARYFATVIGCPFTVELV